MGTFVKSWAAVACGANDIEGVICDCTWLFTLQDFSSFSMPNIIIKDLCNEIVMKRFLFDGSKVAALRVEVGNGPYLDHPTRFEAVAALICGAVMDVTGEENEAMKINIVTSPVDLRKRMDPSLPQQRIGNIYKVTNTNWPRDDKMLD